MEWANFEHHGESPSAAFEALAGLLFERFCRREYGAMLREVRFVRGEGGDGGVEAYAELTSGEVVGLQAKWFRDAFGPDQIGQIDKSFRAAVSVRPELFSRYCVAIPRKLGDDRTKKGASEAAPTGARRRRPETSQRDRWEQWKAKVHAEHPKIDIELWDEAKLEGLLAEPENEGLHAYWFSGSVFSLDDLTRTFEAARGRWLDLRYLPHLHATGELTKDLALRLGEPKARAEDRDRVLDAKRILEAARDAVARLDRYPAFMERVREAQTLREDALEGLRVAVECAKTLEQALGTGERCPGDIPLPPEHVRAVRLLYAALDDAEAKRSLSSLREIRALLGDCLTGMYPAWDRLIESWELFWHNPTTKLVAYVGRPGVGKTHGLAAMVEARLKSGLPAALLRAKECPVHEGLPAIFRSALDSPQMPLRKILNALEATAARADVRRVRSGTGEPLPKDIEHEPTCFLLAIDGLEESGEPQRWAELLGELSLHLASHPRIRVAVSLRTSARDSILGRMKPPAYDEIVLPEDGEVQELLPKYCKAYGIEEPERRLRFAIRDPLTLRLFCELASGGSGWTPSRTSISVPSLLAEKLRRAEKEVCERERTSEDDEPLRTLLNELAVLYARTGPVKREDLLRAAFDRNDLVSREVWKRVFDHAKAQGLVLSRRTPEMESLRERSGIFVEPANEPLLDYLLAEAAAFDAKTLLASGRAPEALQRLSSRPDAMTQAAILLAGAGVDLLRPDLFPAESTEEQIETWVLRALASMEDAGAERYREWVRARLVASLPSCRRVLSELCIPVARDETHPFRPRFVHETLLPFSPAMRDAFWSAPPDLRGDGEPWAGPGVEALERLRLEEGDAAEGPPLLLGWALTSVDNRWRRRLRADLAQWGAGQLDELIRWLELVLETNDPQMAEDAAMVAFGAACLAGTNPRLAALVEWVDANLLAPDAPRRREDIVVLHAARGIVERAKVMGVPVREEMLENARRLYSTKDELLPMDAQAAREADERWGISPITGDFAWYVVPGAIQPFFRSKPDPRAGQVVEAHARAAGIDALSPQKFAFGVLSAHLREMGWSQASDEMSGAIADRYPQETHGARSPVSAVDEKYVWTGCYALLAYLAARVPIRDDVDGGALEPPVDPVLVADLPPNPVSETPLIQLSSSEGWTFWPDKGLAPPLDLQATEQLKRAIEWVERAPEPDLRPWLILRGDESPDGTEWVTLRCIVEAREEDSQGESILHASSAWVTNGEAKRLKSGGGIRRDTRRCTHPRELREFGESIPCKTHIDPSEALWAPWAKGVYGVEHVEVSEEPEGSSAIRLFATTAGANGIWLPSHSLRRALDLVHVKRRNASSDEWHFMDRAGSMHAIYTRRTWEDARSEALVIRRSSLEEALAEGETIVWPIWLSREPNPSLPGRDHRLDFPWARRDWELLAFMGEGEVDVLLTHQSIETHPDERSSSAHPEGESPTPEPSSSVIQVGPTNPDLAVPLSSELDDDSAIPYFLWDDPMTVAEFRHRLQNASSPERDRLLGLLLREARDPDVWRFTTPEEVDARFDSIGKHLGRRKAFWVFLLDAWRKEGLLGQKSA